MPSHGRPPPAADAAASPPVVVGGGTCGARLPMSPGLSVCASGCGPSRSIAILLIGSYVSTRLSKSTHESPAAFAAFASSITL